MSNKDATQVVDIQKEFPLASPEKKVMWYQQNTAHLEHLCIDFLGIAVQCPGHLRSNRRHPQVSKAFGSMAQRTEVLQEEHVFSAIAYRSLASGSGWTF